MENQMITRTQLDYCPQGYQDLIAFQNARIEALQNELKMTRYSLEIALKDYDEVIQATDKTIDWMNERLFR